MGAYAGDKHFEWIIIVVVGKEGLARGFGCTTAALAAACGPDAPKNAEMESAHDHHVQPECYAYAKDYLPLMVYGIIHRKCLTMF